MAIAVKRGDRVEWITSKGETRGTGNRKIEGEAQAGGHTAKATPQQPQYEVKSGQSGASAIHKPEPSRKLTK